MKRFLVPSFVTLLLLTLNPAGTSADTLPDHVIFRTAQQVSTGLGGLGAMDARCQTKAEAAGLDGTWLALLSASGQSARARLAAAGALGPFYTMASRLVALDLIELFDGAVNAPIFLDEFGKPAINPYEVWTATLPDGSYAGNSYGDWTNFIGKARTGLDTSVDSKWLSWVERSGIYSASLYCVRSSREPVFTPPEPPALTHTIFLSSVAYDGNFGGLEGADAECERLATAAGMGGRTWRAILSDSDAAARDRIMISGPVFNMNDDFVAADFDDLFDGGTAAFVRFDENGDLWQDQLVWTGSYPNGTPYSAAGPSAYKSDWTSSDGWAMAGETLELGAKWISSTLNAGWPARLYCIDQAPGSSFSDTWDPGDSFGDALAACDFNGDGKDDLAIGVPGEGIDYNGEVYKAGAVNVLYGKGGVGLQATSPDDQILHQAGWLFLPEMYDFFGSTLACGEFTGDGYDDLAIGVPGEGYTIAGTFFDRAGVVEIYRGSQDGLQYHHYFRHDGASFQGFGQALAAGDFDDDGIDDLAVGIPRANLATVDRAGAVLVYYGPLNPLGEGETQPFTWLSQGWEHVIGKAEYGDEFGYALAAADFDGNGRADLAVSAPSEWVDKNRVAFAGSVWIFYFTGRDSYSNASFKQGEHGVQEQPEMNDYFGTSLAAGNFNNDDYHDLAIGVPHESLSDFDGNQHGVVHVLYGSLLGLQALGGPWGPNDDLWYQDKDGGKLEGLAEDGDLFGFALTAGDFNDDGADDLAIGVPFEDAQKGRVNVVYGSQDDGLTTAGDQSWRQEVEDRHGHRMAGNYEEDDIFGTALAAGDFDGNGWDDLAIGVPGEGVPTGDGSTQYLGAGAVNILYGGKSPDDDLLCADGSKTWHQGSDGVEDDPEGPVG